MQRHRRGASTCPGTTSDCLDSAFAVRDLMLRLFGRDLSSPFSVPFLDAACACRRVLVHTRSSWGKILRSSLDVLLGQFAQLQDKVALRTEKQESRDTAMGLACGTPRRVFSAELIRLTLLTARKHFVETHIW